MSLAYLSNNKLFFKFPLINYIIKNASTNVLFKLCKCHKQLKAMIKAAHGLFADLLYISDDPYHHRTKQIRAYPFTMFYRSLNAEFKFDDPKLSEKNPLKVRNQLDLCLKRNQKFDSLLPKLDLTKMKRIFIKQGCMDFAVLKDICNPSLIIASFELTVVEGCDAFKYILLNCSNIESLTLLWQSNITSFAACSNLQRDTKLKQLTIHRITEYIEPEEVATFVKNQMENNAKLSINFWINLPLMYDRKVEALIEEKKICSTIFCPKMG